MKKLGVFFIYVLFLPTLLFSNEYIRAHVERVVDGDTFVVRLDNEIRITSYNVCYTKLLRVSFFIENSMPVVVI